MLYGYFDESERRGRVYSVAGYCFSPDKAERAGREMDRLLGGRIFHATDVGNGKGEFSGDSNEKRMEYSKGVVGISTQFCSYGVSASCEITDAKRVWPKIDGFRSAYCACLNLCVVTIKEWLETRNKAERVAYLIEGGNKSQGEANAYMQRIAENASDRALMRYVSHTFMAKEDAPLLGCADQLAWESAKYMDDFEVLPRRKHDRLPRRSYQVLRGHRKVDMHHADEPKLRMYLETIAEIVARFEAGQC